MYNVVISFHASMSQTDWRGRSLTSLFPGPGTQTFFVEGGSTLACKALDPRTPPTTCIKHSNPDCPQGKCTGYSDLINRYAKSVDRSPADPKYVAADPKTHKRQSILQGMVERVHPQLANKQYRVCVIGFSEGCGGVGVCLKSADIGYVDTAVAIDGIHWGKQKNCPIGSACMREYQSAWMKYAAMAAFGKSPDNPTIQTGSRCLVITNSDTPPPECCRQSKEATAIIRDTILGNVQGSRVPPPGLWPAIHSPPLVFGQGPSQVTYTQSQSDWYKNFGGLFLLSYKNIDRNGSGHFDHIYQSKVILPLVIEKIVVPRWNASTGGTIIGV